MSNTKVYVKIAFDFIMALVSVLIIVFVLPKMIIFFMPIIIGYVISLIANPVVRFLEEKVRMVRKHGSALVICLVIGIVSIILYGIIYILFTQIYNVIEELPYVYLRLERSIQAIVARFEDIVDKMPSVIRVYVDRMLSYSGEVSLEGFSSIKVAKMTITGLTSGIIYIIFTIMSAYYFTAEKDKILCRMRLCMPGKMMSSIRQVAHKFIGIIGDYIKVQLKIMIILIVVLFLGLTIFEIRYSFAISLIIGVLDMLPVLGIGVVLIPWAIGALIMGDYILGLELIILYILCVVIREVAEPKMFGKKIGLSSFGTFLIMYIGLRVAGFVGLIFALPLAIIIINLYKAGAFDVLIEDLKFLYKEISRFSADVKEK